MDLLRLQNKLKKDPISYKSECLLQFQHFQNQLQIFQLKPEHSNKTFEEQIKFFSHVTPYYKEELRDYPQQIFNLVEQKYSILNPDIRKAIVKALIQLRNRNVLTALSLLPLLFKLFRCKDKDLRTLLYNHIVNDIRKVNAKNKNNQVNNSLQNFMFTMIQDEAHSATRKSVQVLIELYRKSVWNDAKTVNIISMACFYKDTKTMMTAINFFLGPIKEVQDESDDEKKTKAKELFLKFKNSHSKKTRKKNKRLEAAIHNMQKVHEKKQDGGANFAAIALLNNPQGFAEKLFTKLKGSVEKFDVKLVIMNLISRVIGYHKIILLPFYSFMQKYMQPHQTSITYLLAIVAQSSHDLIPEEILGPLVKTLANHFVNDRTSPEVMTIGLNTIREICGRCPLAVDSTLLRDLVQYKSHRNKGVGIAAKSLVGLYRRVNPNLLSKKDRGKFASQVPAPLRYGESRVQDSVPGLDLLEEDEMNGEDDDENWREFLEEDEESLDGSWVTVDHGDEEALTDDDEEDNTETVDEDFETDDEGEEIEDEDGEEVDEEEEEVDGEEVDEDEDEEGWVDVDEDDGMININTDSEGEEDSAKEKKSPLKRKREEEESGGVRILGQEDFERIQYLRIKQNVEPPNKKQKDSRGKMKKKAPVGFDRSDEFVEESTIVSGVKRKVSAEERREQAKLAQAESKQKFTSFQSREGKASSNYEKRKKMPFPMVKNSRAHRMKNNVTEKAKALRFKKKQFGFNRKK